MKKCLIILLILLLYFNIGNTSLAMNYNTTNKIDVIFSNQTFHTNLDELSTVLKVNVRIKNISRSKFNGFYEFIIKAKDEMGNVVGEYDISKPYVGFSSSVAKNIEVVSKNLKGLKLDVGQTTDGEIIMIYSGTNNSNITFAWEAKPNISNTYKDDIVISYMGNVVNYPDEKPFIENNRTLVPVRGLLEDMGSKVEWIDKTQEVRITNPFNDVLKLRIGSKKAYINGKEYTLDVPAKLKNGRTYIPLRFVSQGLGYTVEWSNQHKVVLIYD